MTKIMTFNGVDMSKYFKITDIIRPIGNNRSVSTDNAPLLGVNIKEVRRGPKEHTIKFSMISSSGEVLESLKHELAGVLNVLEPVKIVYSDEPDKYYMGFPIDDVTTDNVTRWFQRSEIKLLIPDGVAHSSTYKDFNSDSNAKILTDKMVFDITNNGTEPAYPIIRVKHNSENGYIGLVNKASAFEMGNREEMDSEIVKASEVLLDYRGANILKGFQNGTNGVAVTNDNKERLVGTLSTTSMWGRNHIELSNRGTVEKNRNNAQSLTWTIPADSSGEVGSLNDYLLWRQVFMAAVANQYGFIKVTVSDTDGNFLYGVETYKRYQTLDCEYSFFTADGNGSYKFIKWWYFIGTGAQVSKTDPFSAEKGWTELKRNDEKVQVFFDGSHYNFVVPELKGKKSAKINVTLGALRDWPLISHMYIDEFMYRKDFVNHTRDIPNRYPIGSNVVINSEEDSVYIDGMAKTSEVVDGSHWPEIPPGKSQLELYFSRFVKQKPTVTIEFEERWI